MKCNFILYVKDQARSRRFYAAALGLAPELDVPGMTEFRLSELLDGGNVFLENSQVR